MFVMFVSNNEIRDDQSNFYLEKKLRRGNLIRTRGPWPILVSPEKRFPHVATKKLQYYYIYGYARHWLKIIVLIIK